jgi:hypothetical protein
MNVANSVGAAPVQVRRKKKSVVFTEEVDIINPEDIDPSIGRFRNMISTTIVIPNKVCRAFFDVLSIILIILDKVEFKVSRVFFF